MFESDWQSKAATAEPAPPTARPVVRGTRVAVDFVQELLGDGWTPQEIARHFGHITGDGLKAAGIETEDESAADAGADSCPDFPAMNAGRQH